MNTEDLKKYGQQTVQEIEQYEAWMRALYMGEEVEMRLLLKNIESQWDKGGRNHLGHWSYLSSQKAIRFTSKNDGVRYVFHIRTPFSLQAVEGEAVLDFVVDIYDGDLTEVAGTVQQPFMLAQVVSREDLAAQFVRYIHTACQAERGRV